MYVSSTLQNARRRMPEKKATAARGTSSSDAYARKSAETNNRRKKAQKAQLKTVRSKRKNHQKERRKQTAMPVEKNETLLPPSTLRLGRLRNVVELHVQTLGLERLAVAMPDHELLSRFLVLHEQIKAVERKGEARPLARELLVGHNDIEAAERVAGVDASALALLLREVQHVAGVADDALQLVRYAVEKAVFCTLPRPGAAVQIQSEHHLDALAHKVHDAVAYVDALRLWVDVLRALLGQNTSGRPV